MKTASEFDGVYQIASPFQLDCNGTVGFSLNIRRILPGVNDIEIGSDLAIVRSPVFESAGDFISVSRSSVVIPPGKTSPYLALLFPVVCGFIPCGAHLSDGRPHPHAGTGFGFSHIIALPCTPDGTLEGPERIHERMKDSVTLVELFQFSYDGTAFTVRERTLLNTDELISGWRFVSCPLGECIPDGSDGILSGLVAVEQGVSSPGRSGIIRWGYRDGGWHPFSFTPVSPEGTREPSFVRDSDGSLLFTARGADESLPADVCPDGSNRHDLRLWRSEDDGLTWSLICHERFKCANTPICLGMTLDGTPFLTGNPLPLSVAELSDSNTGNMRGTLVM